MNDSRSGRRGLSRSEKWFGVVAALIVIVAAVQLSGRFERRSLPAPDSTPDVAGPPTAAAPIAARPIARLVFDAGSSKLPGGSEGSIGSLSGALRSDSTLSATISAYYSAGNRRDLALAAKRAEAVRHALEADGVSLRRLTVQTLDASAGGASGGGPSSGSRAGSVDIDVH